MQSSHRRLGQYDDIRAILDAALAAGGGTVELADHGQAVQWRHRAYRFRKAYAEAFGPSVASKYDQLTLPRLSPEATTVTIRLIKQAAIFRPAAEPQFAPAEPDDELLEAAKQLLNDKGDVL